MQTKSKRKYLAVVTSFENNRSFNAFINGFGFIIDKICEKFEKIYIINVANLKLFSEKKKVFDYKLNRNFELPHNIEFYSPQNSNDFKNFMKEKELVVINDFGTRIPELRIFFLFKQHKIKQVQISYVTNVPYYNWGPLKKSFFKNLLWKFKHVYAHKFTVLLSNLGLISKIDIRFVTNPDIIMYTKTNSNIYRKFVNSLELSFAKEFILINGRSYDQLRSNKTAVDENQIVLLDEQLDEPQYSQFRKLLDKKQTQDHYYKLNKMLKQLSNIYNKKIIVCIHPADDLELKKKYFLDFEVVKYQTRKNIYKAFMVLFFQSTAIVDAIILKKRVATIVSNTMDKNQMLAGFQWIKALGIEKIDIENNLIVDANNKNTFLLKLDKATKNYSSFINSYITVDGANLGYEKIINTLKSRFFN